MRQRSVLAGLLTGVAMLASLLAVPAAWAGDQANAAAPVTEIPVPQSPAVSPPGAVALAHTGLDITLPAMVGLAILLIGTALVAWAVLRGSRPGRSHR